MFGRHLEINFKTEFSSVPKLPWPWLFLQALKKCELIHKQERACAFMLVASSEKLNYDVLD